MSFYSDNAAPAAPQILEAVLAANSGFKPPYGADDLTHEAGIQLGRVFGCELAGQLVATGTASNALALSVLCPPYGVIFCHEEAHIAVAEAGAPEFYTNGAKLMPLPGQNGKLDLKTLEQALDGIDTRRLDRSKPACLSLTQLTEAGTVYTLSEVRGLAELAHSKGLRVHMDGARFANAVATLNCSPAEASWKSGVDVLSFGATKNGALAAEAVLLFDKSLSDAFAIRQKRGGHVLSKHRFVAAQFLAYLKDDLWLDLARKANASAQRLASGLVERGLRLIQPVQGNEVFVILTQAQRTTLTQSGFAFVARETDGQILARFVTSFATASSDIDKLLACLS